MNIHQIDPVISNRSGFISIEQIISDLIPLSKATYYRCVQSGDYPAPVRVFANRSAWRKADIKAPLVELGGAECSR